MIPITPLLHPTQVIEITGFIYPIEIELVQLHKLEIELKSPAGP